MPKIQFSIPQVRPLQLTHPRFNGDQIYFAYVIHAGKINDPKVVPVAGRLSSIRETGVKKPLKSWVPATHGSTDSGGAAMAVEVDVGDADCVIIHLHMYEADNRNLWHDMAKDERLGMLVHPAEFDWRNAIVPLTEIPKVCSNAKTKEDLAICVIKQLVKAAGFAVRHLRQDDLMFERSLVIDLAPEPSTTRDRGTNQWKVECHGGQYEVTTSVVVVE